MFYFKISNNWNYNLHICVAEQIFLSFCQHFLGIWSTAELGRYPTFYIFWSSIQSIRCNLYQLDNITWSQLCFSESLWILEFQKPTKILEMITINTIKCELSHKNFIATLGYGLFLLRNLFPQRTILKLFIKKRFSLLLELIFPKLTSIV